MGMLNGWRRRTFTAAGLTQVPSGPYVPALARRFVGTVKVTRSGYDDIGAVLQTMGVAFEPWNGSYECCDLLFMNCGTSDVLDPGELRQFV